MCMETTCGVLLGDLPIRESRCLYTGLNVLSPDHRGPFSTQEKFYIEEFKATVIPPEAITMMEIFFLTTDALCKNTKYLKPWWEHMDIIQAVASETLGWFNDLKTPEEDWDWNGWEEAEKLAHYQQIRQEMTSQQKAAWMFKRVNGQLNTHYHRQGKEDPFSATPWGCPCNGEKTEKELREEEDDVIYRLSQLTVGASFQSQEEDEVDTVINRISFDTVKDVLLNRLTPAPRKVMEKFFFEKKQQVDQCKEECVAKGVTDKEEVERIRNRIAQTFKRGVDDLKKLVKE